MAIFDLIEKIFSDDFVQGLVGKYVTVKFDFEGLYGFVKMLASFFMA